MLLGILTRFAAWLHAATHWPFRPKHERDIRALHAEVADQFMHLGLMGEQERDELTLGTALVVADRFGVEAEDRRILPLVALTRGLLDGEAMFILPPLETAKPRTIAEWWELRDELNYQKHLTDDFENTCHLIRQLIGVLTQQLYQACPSLYEERRDEEGIGIETDLLHALGGTATLVENMLEVVFAEDLVDADLFGGLRAKLEANTIAASGGNPDDPASFNRAPKYPSQFAAKSPEHLLQTYLNGTPLMELFDQSLTFTIPTSSRFEHHHIVAGSGHGKTQTLQYLIAHDLETVARGQRSVVVIDSQGDLIRNISQLAIFAPDGPLHDRIVIIDPSDVEYPVSLNLFDVGIERLGSYNALERERLTNSILELYDFVLGSLLDAAMTQKQNVIFRYVTRLMLHIPGATIHTLRDLMEPGASAKFAAHIAKLEGSARRFFESEFDSKEFEQTKRQVLRRLWGILENQTFERMFAHPKSKLDLFAEMNAGKVILINTAKDLLKEQGTQIFGRFFIAMIAQAAQERATLPENKRMPTMVYVDEAQDYFDSTIAVILAQARKYNVGMVLAHQYLGQLEPKLQEAFAANTSIKFAGGVSNKDARSLAAMMGCSPELIEGQSKGSFAASVRGRTKHALPLSVPFGVMEELPVMSMSERDAVQDIMRSRYAVHISEIAQQSVQSAGAERAEKEEPALNTEPKPAGIVDTEPGSEW